VEWALLLSHLVPTVHNQCMNDTTGRGSKKKHGTRKMKKKKITDGDAVFRAVCRERSGRTSVK
jgi:hypothetical protein